MVDECTADPCPGQYCADPTPNVDAAGDWTCACYVDSSDPTKGIEPDTLNRGARAECGDAVGTTIAVVVGVIVGIAVCTLCFCLYMWLRKRRRDRSPVGIEEDIDLDEPLNPEDMQDRIKTIDVYRPERREKLGGKFRGNKNLTFLTVKKESPYDRAGLSPGMKILEVNGKPVTSKQQLAKQVAGQPSFVATVLVPKRKAHEIDVLSDGDAAAYEENNDERARTLRAMRGRIDSESLPHHLSDLQQKMPREARHLLDHLSSERDVLKDQVRNMEALFHPPDCRFCTGGSTWGFAPPKVLSPAPADDAVNGEACLPFAVILDTYAEYGWDPPLTAEELHEKEYGLAKKKKRNKTAAAAATAAVVVDADAAPRGRSGPGTGGNGDSDSPKSEGRLRRWTRRARTSTVAALKGSKLTQTPKSRAEDPEDPGALSPDADGPGPHVEDDADDDDGSYTANPRGEDFRCEAVDDGAPPSGKPDGAAAAAAAATPEANRRLSRVPSDANDVQREILAAGALVGGGGGGGLPPNPLALLGGASRPPTATPPPRLAASPAVLPEPKGVLAALVPQGGAEERRLSMSL